MRAREGTHHLRDPGEEGLAAASQSQAALFADNSVQIKLKFGLTAAASSFLTHRERRIKGKIRAPSIIKGHPWHAHTHSTERPISNRPLSFQGITRFELSISTSLQKRERERKLEGHLLELYFFTLH